jgi:hypothetical protein
VLFAEVAVIGYIDSRVMSASSDSMRDGQPEPSHRVMLAATEFLEVLHHHRLEADVSPDALGGLSLIVGDSARYVWISLLNSGARTVSFVSDGMAPFTVSFEKASMRQIRDHVGMRGVA